MRYNIVWFAAPTLQTEPLLEYQERSDRMKRALGVFLLTCLLSSCLSSETKVFEGTIASNKVTYYSSQSPFTGGSARMVIEAGASTWIYYDDNLNGQLDKIERIEKGEPLTFEKGSEVDMEKKILLDANAKYKYYLGLIQKKFESELASPPK